MATVDTRPLVVVAAEPRELAGVLQHCLRRRRLRWPVRFARSAELGGRRVVLVANGCGARLAGEACEVAWNKHRASGMVSTGFCGALDPALPLAGVFVASRVESLDGAVAFDSRPPESTRPHTVGRLVSTDHVVRATEEKQSLRGRGASAVEMEALAVGLRATRWGIPFYCVRAVTDLAEEGFRTDFNAARAEDGHLSTARILGAAIRRPYPVAPELIKLYHRSHLAARALGDFFADCRF